MSVSQYLCRAPPIRASLDAFVLRLLHRNIHLMLTLCHRLNCDGYLGDVMGSVLMCIFHVD